MAQLRADQLWQPATFQERGVAVPFTTPMLAGTRLRVAADRAREMIVPHPAGARGVYILPCQELAHFCTPTLHDCQLIERLGGISAITPRSVRAAALQVCAEGYAGRAAAEAARCHAAADQADQRAATHDLLADLVLQGTGAACAPADLDRLAKRELLRLAGQLNRPGADLLGSVEQLASRLAGATMSAAAPPRAARLVARIEALAAVLPGVAAGADAGDSPRFRQAVALLQAAACLAASLAGAALADMRALQADPARLIAAWVTDRPGLAPRLVRASYLLDGWEQICRLWHAGPDASRKATIIEMALQLPVLPSEALGAAAPGMELALRQQRADVLGGGDWRHHARGAELVARNERMLAQAA